VRTLLAFLLLVGVSTPAAAQWPDVVEALIPRLVPFEQPDVDGPSCTGSVINAAAGYVLTAAHCIPKDAGELAIAGRDVDVKAINRQLDLAVVKTRLRKEASQVALAPLMPRAGSAVAVVGFPFGARSLVVQIGVIANPDVDGQAWINADALPGDSGGAIVDEQGRLVGVTLGYKAHGAAHIGRAATLETVRAFVADFLP
jgi:S1-C subfamily serine protease